LGKIKGVRSWNKKKKLSLTKRKRLWSVSSGKETKIFPVELAYCTRTVLINFMEGAKLPRPRELRFPFTTVSPKIPKTDMESFNKLQ
jgi:hypothetical protein